MNKKTKTKTVRPQQRPLFVAELGSVAGGYNYPSREVFTTRSSLEGQGEGISE
jgi:hypothetical protein